MKCAYEIWHIFSPEGEVGIQLEVAVCGRTGYRCLYAGECEKCASGVPDKEQEEEGGDHE